MNIHIDKIRVLATCLALSLLAHLLFLYTLRMCGTYNFARPVNQLQTVMVDLAKPAVAANATAAPMDNKSANSVKMAKEPKKAVTTPRANEDGSPPPAAPKQHQAESDQTQDVPITANKPDSSNRSSGQKEDQLPAASRQLASTPEILPPLRTTSEFLTAKTEKLSYLISILGMPVGNAELEAKNVKGEVRITLGVKTNAALASIYPVNDLMETRHIAGNFVITNIRQQEGDFKSDVGFTIFLRDKSVFWFDRLRKRYSREAVPNSEVLDVLSGFYLLRNRALQIGRTETLDIYDGDNYSPILVEVLRQETVRLPNLRKIDSLVIHPIRKNGGTFRKAGDMLIWLTNDDNKVPIKVETSLPLGKVTAELISAEAVQ